MNSFHLLGAILHLHARKVADDATRGHLKDVRARIAAMSIVHRQLCHGDGPDAVDIDGVLRGLCDEAAQTGRELAASEPAAIAVDSCSLIVPADTAMSLALLAHELIALAMRWSGVGTGVSVALRRDKDDLRLTVIAGGGLTRLGIATSDESLEMQLVHSLTRQLRGRFSTERGAAETRFSLVVPAVPRA